MNLNEAIQQAESGLAQNEQGHLQLGFRRAIWAALGDRGENGRRARARLAMQTSEHVRPIWSAAWPEDDLPERLAELTRQALTGAVDSKSLSRQVDSAQNHFDDLVLDHPEQMATVAAGYSAQRALACALYDEVFAPGDLDLGARDEDAEPHERDAAFLAAFASSGGAPWDIASRSEDRRAFWRWWLGEVVRMQREVRP